MTKIVKYQDWKSGKHLKEAMVDGSQADSYASQKGLEVKTFPDSEKSELTSGGTVESILIDVAAELEKKTGLTDFIITSGNDKFHKNFPNSWHFKGYAIDIVATSLNNKANRLKTEQAFIDLMKSKRYNVKGLRLGGINEYDNLTKYATGGHFHISLTPDDTSRDGYECNFALSGITSYKQIREGKTIEKKEVQLSSRIKNISKKRRYFRLFYGEEKNIILLKLIDENNFKVYSRKKTQIGNISIDGNNVTLIKTSGENIDLTSKKLGQKVLRLQERIKSPKVEKEESESFQTVGEIKHDYSGKQAKNIRIIEETAKSMGITNPNSIIGMLSVIGKESEFIPKSENMNYSKERLPEIWGFFSKTGKRVSKGEGRYNYNNKAKKYEYNPEKLANFVYGEKPKGLRKDSHGNTEIGDGWKYRGRGFNQITFKGNYQKYSDQLGIDLIGNPDLLNDPNIAARVVIQFFLNSFKQKGIDPNSFKNVDEAIEKFAHANAGWGSNLRIAIANANKYKSKFQLA